MQQRRLADLDRQTLLRVGREYMMLGHLIDRALMPQLLIRVGPDAMEPVAIDEWMGASPVYTRRMRELMGIEGDGTSALIKSLQLDVGFVHQYMDVGYRIQDEEHAEFWLNHCGALLDAEPGGDDFVIMMCHHIEDPTFDATATAVNPRARIRPIHRPPRTPADREPHCHWTIIIDPEVEPLRTPEVARAVTRLPLASLPVVAPDPDLPTDDGWTDYSGAVDPEFGLHRLSSAALVAVLGEFRTQCDLIVSAADLTISSRFGADVARDVLAAQWVGASWIASERICAALRLDPDERAGAEAVAAVLTLHPAFPAGHEVDVVEDGDGGLLLRLTATRPDLARPDTPGWAGVAARGDAAGIEAMARGVDPRARVAEVTRPEPGVAEVRLAFDTEPASEPTAVEVVRISTAAAFAFT